MPRPFFERTRKLAEHVRELAANALLAILNGATFTVVKTNDETEP